MFKRNNRPSEDIEFDYRVGNSYLDTVNQKKRAERDIDCKDQAYRSASPAVSKADQLAVYQPEQYAKLEGVLTKKLQTLTDNIDISRQKNRLKDKEIQIIAQSIDKIIQKIGILESKVALKEKKLSKISIKCHDQNTEITKQQEKIKKETIVLSQQASKCQSFLADIRFLEQKYRTAQRQLDNCKKICNSIGSIESENEQLRHQLTQLQNQEKMIEYMQNNEKLECEELQSKLEELKNIYKERTKINKRNMMKLNNLKKEISGSQDNQNLITRKIEEIKHLELQLGEYNQQLLLFNEEITEFDFKIRKKEKSIADLREKLRTESYELNSRRRENHKIIESEDQASKTENNSSKTSKKNSQGKNQQLSINSKNVSPARNRSNLTPTFPSNELQGMQQTSSKQMRSVEEVPNDAFKNIEKLINRFEQIKNKEKHKNN